MSLNGLASTVGAGAGRLNFGGNNGTALACPLLDDEGNGVTPVLEYFTGVAELGFTTGGGAVVTDGSGATTILSDGTSTTASGFDSATGAAAGGPACGGTGVDRTTTGFATATGRATAGVFVSFATGAVGGVVTATGAAGSGFCSSVLARAFTASQFSACGVKAR